jgi:hypothetical protein
MFSFVSPVGLSAGFPKRLRGRGVVSDINLLMNIESWLNSNCVTQSRKAAEAQRFQPRLELD